MRCERLVLSGDALDTVARLRALIPAPGSVTETVAEILAEVRSHGDEALSAYTRRFDTAGASPAPLLVSDAELEDAQRRLDPAVRSGLEQAI